jgi:hypothetical protein
VEPAVNEPNETSAPTLVEEAPAGPMPADEQASAETTESAGPVGSPTRVGPAGPANPLAPAGPTDPLAPNAHAWRELPDGVRQQIRLNFPPQPVDADHARAAVAYARHRRRVLQPALLVSLALIVALGLWAILVGHWPGTWAPASRSATLYVLLALLGVSAVAAVVLGASTALVTRMEAANLPAAVADVPDETPGTLNLNWRFSRPQRALHAVVAALGILAYVFGLWLFADTPTKIFDAAVVLVLAARVVYVWPWPIASSYPVLATLDDHGIRVHPLGLSVPWHRITRVSVVAGFGGPALVWRIEDPAAVAAAAPVSPGQQRRLLRWMTSHGGAIRLSGSQMRERPEVAFIASVRFRTFRVSQYSGLPGVHLG